MRHIGFATQAPHFMIIPEVHQSVNRTPVIAIDGVESGPFTYEDMNRKVANDELPSHALFWKEGMTEWVSIKEAL